MTRFSWNADDRLTDIELPNGTRYRYRYDPFGRRIAKECAHSDTQTHYLWDGAHIVQQQQATADGQVLQQTEYLYEPGSFRPMAQVTHHEQGSELHYIVTDHAGTPQELCNEQGDIVWRGEQALWGHYHGQSQRHWQRREEAANDSIQCDLRYQGQLEDPESSLYYNVNRYYDADSGQYLSPDPIGFAGGLRPQAYVANPLEWVDPLGLAGAAHGGEGEDVTKTAGKGEVFYKTTKEATAAAKELGFEKTKFKAQGETVYFNKKTKRYISRDVGSGDGNGAHNGGVWKMAKSVKDLWSKNSRIGTFDANLNKIGDWY